MKTQAIKTTRWALPLATLFCLFSTAALAGVADTKHNLSTSGTGDIVSTDQQEICVFCHTPHNAIKNDNIPLWNHDLSTNASYGVYTSPTFDATDGADLGGIDETTASVSNLCLSCHDGTVAINSFNNPSNQWATTTMTDNGTGKLDADSSLGSTSSAMLGTDLTDDHPVNFTYASSVTNGDAGLNAEGGLTNVKLFNGSVQCASCHDPHTSQEAVFLRASMAGSALCLECHNK